MLLDSPVGLLIKSAPTMTAAYADFFDHVVSVLNALSVGRGYLTENVTPIDRGRFIQIKRYALSLMDEVDGLAALYGEVHKYFRQVDSVENKEAFRKVGLEYKARVDSELKSIRGVCLGCLEKLNYMSDEIKRDKDFEYVVSILNRAARVGHDDLVGGFFTGESLFQ